MINQYQALMLIPILNLYLPKTVRDFIVGNSATLFSFSFLHIQDISFISSLNNDLGGDQTDEYLKEIGIMSNSVIINHMNLIIVYLVIFIMHMSIWLIARLIKLKLKSKESKCNKIMSKIIDVFTFGVYIRLLIESFQFMML